MSTALGSTRVRRILVAYTVNRLGEWFGLLALVVAVYDHTHSALAVAALLFAGQALPAFAVPALVARVEASPRRSELSALYFVEAVTTAAMAAIIAYGFSLAGILILVAVDGTAALAASALLRAETARAARAAVGAGAGGLGPGADQELEEDVAAEAERRANAALNVSFSLTFVVGPALGGALVASAGAPVALLVDVGSFLIIGGLLLDLRPHVEEAVGNSVRARLAAAWRHINDVAMLRWLLVAETVAMVFIETGAPIEVSFVKVTLHAGDRGLGLILAMWGVGAVLGSLLFARMIRRPLDELLGAGTLLVGLAYLGLAVAPSLSLACVAGVVGGIGNGLQWPSLISLVQRLTPGRLQGRMMGAVEALGALALAAGLVLGGILVALTTPRSAFVIVGIGACASTVALVRIAALALRRAVVADEAPKASAAGRTAA